MADKPRRIMGADPVIIPDEAIWTDRLRRDFEPEIPIEIREYRAAGQSIVAVGVEGHTRRPIICKRTTTIKIERLGKQTDEVVIQDGTVYYRQSGQTRPIAHSELQALLQERDDRRLRAFLQNVQIMQEIGAEKVGIVDASQTGVPGKDTKLYVSREVAKSLNFIDKGRFVESNEEGTPAYIVAGTVQLNEVIERPLDDADRNFPNEAAEKIRPVVEELFGAGTPFTGHHLAKLSKYLGVRNGVETDQRYCVYDQKVGRVFYLRTGIEYLTAELREASEDCLRAFASKATLQLYEARNGNAGG